MPQVTKESFARALQALVRKYEGDRDTYLSSQYNEAQTRTQFISPLLEALGWDVRNEDGVPYNQCEVLEEKGETHGRPDYTFRINGQTKFFFEAKRPSALPLQRDDILQTKRYAWSGGIYFAGICDFEQFKFFDASLRPDEKHPLDGDAIDFIYSQYAANIDKLWELSRDRVAAGSLDQFLRKDRKSLLQKVPFDKDFLDNLTKWRHQLASAIHAQNPERDAHELNDIVQRLLDRIIFVRIAEDRKVIDERQLWDAVSIWERSGGRRNIMDFLIDLFHTFNDRFNGEIFKPHPCEEVKIESHVLAKIVHDLYPPRSNYNFDAIGVELLGSIYERYLGNTLSITASGVKIVPKPEVRKAGGVYYTPKYIVDFIVKNTVGKLVEDKKTPKEVDKIRILDPACGSGSFLIGAFQFLIDWHLNYYREYPKEAASYGLVPMTRTDQDGNLRLSFYAKSLIIQHNLYGVDIDPQAVEVTMMSLYLKMLEGELGIQIPKQDKLPELKYNIRCGNSLIGPDIEKDKPFTPEERQRINPFDWNSRENGFGDIMKSGGFDAVIGNPPWGQKAVQFREVDKAYYARSYKVATGILDLFKLFVERAISVTRPEGHWGMILPDIVLLKDYPETRRLILERTEITSLAYAGMAFESVNLDSVCVICHKRATCESTRNKVLVIRNLMPGGASGGSCNDTAELPQALFWRLQGFKFNIHLDDTKLALLEKLQKLPRFATAFEAHEGIHSGNIRSKLFLDKKTSPVCKKLIFGRQEIDRYYLQWHGRWVLYDEKAIDRHRGEYANLAKPEYFESDKVFIRRTGDYVMAVPDHSGFYASNNLFVLLPKNVQHACDLRIAAALLNSRTLTWFFRTIQPRVGKVFAELKINHIADFPLPTLDRLDPARSAAARRIVALVERILKLSKEKRSGKIAPSQVKRVERDIAATDAELDELVYGLYDITKDERKIIEGATQ